MGHNTHGFAFMRFIASRIPRWLLVTWIASLFLGVILLELAVLSGSAARATFSSQNDGAQLEAVGNVIIGERPEQLDIRADLSYPPESTTADSVVVVATIRSIFADSHEPIEDQLAVLYSNGWTIEAELDLAGADYVRRSMDMRAGHAAWSVRPKSVGRYRGVVHLSLKPQPTRQAELAAAGIRVNARRDAQLAMIVNEAPITFREGVRALLFVLGSFATLPGLWLLIREYRAFRGDVQASRDPVILTPEEYERERALKRDRH